MIFGKLFGSLGVESFCSLNITFASYVVIPGLNL